MAERSPASPIGIGATVFLGSLLLFLIQPIVGRRILPWYGGSPAVWTTCLLFFQCTLLAGYAYAHVLIRRVSPRGQSLVHGALLVAALLPGVLPGSDGAPEGPGSPVLHILSMLGRSIGLPFFVLAASAPLLQAWAARLHPGRPPWRLFAASNGGSLAALAGYPLLMVPALPVPGQARAWKAGLVVYAGLVALVLVRVARGAAIDVVEAGAGSTGAEPAGDSRRPAHPALWIAWSAIAVVLFMAVTNELSLNIASVPFLWTMPLGLYLLSFVVTFAGPAAYPRRAFAVLLVAAYVVFWIALLGGSVPALDGATLSSGRRIVLSGLGLFVCCMVCHGELYRLRPPAAQLTRFYLAISVGGVLGGVLVGAIAPRYFLLHDELEIGLLACGTLCLVTLLREGPAALGVGRTRAAGALVLAAVLGVTVVSYRLTRRQLRGTIHTARDFFGLVRVRDVQDADGTRHRELAHGSTLHGLQLLGKGRSDLPTIYYGPISGVGLALQARADRDGLAVGVIGMGAATLAAYGRPDDRFRFYEIDPEVVRVARKYFTFLGDSPATCSVRIGDGRLSLERDEGALFDVLVLDAFNSDAIPVHLLTLEAMGVYENHLKGDGVLAFHVSNHYLDLAAVVAKLAEERRFRAVEIENRDEPDGPTREATWMILSRDESFFEKLAAVSRRAQRAGLVRIRNAGQERTGRVRAWTDARTNLLRILR